MDPQWLDVIGPFGAFIAFLVYQLIQRRQLVKRNGNGGLKIACPSFDHHADIVESLMKKIADTNAQIVQTQAVQAQILSNMEKTMDRVERKMEGRRG